MINMELLHFYITLVIIDVSGCKNVNANVASEKKI